MIIMSKRSGSSLLNDKPGKRVNSASESDDTLPADLTSEDSVDNFDVLENVEHQNLKILFFPQQLLSGINCL